MATRLIAKLRYMGRQYSAGQVARGGEGQKHYLEEAADTLETQAARITELEAKNAELLTEVARLNRWADGFTDAHLKERQTGDILIKEVRVENDTLRQQLTASQAREKVLRVGFEEVFRIAKMNQSTWGGWMRDHADTMLALPQDTTALDELLAKERERICNVMELQLSERQRGIIRSLK